MKNFINTFIPLFCYAWTIVSLLNFLFYSPTNGFMAWLLPVGFSAYALFRYDKERKSDKKDAVIKFTAIVAGAWICTVMLLLFK